MTSQSPGIIYLNVGVFRVEPPSLDFLEKGYYRLEYKYLILRTLLRQIWIVMSYFSLLPTKEA